jgi:hypothetical protein
MLCYGCFAHGAKLVLVQKLSINWPCAANEENGDAWLLHDARKEKAESREQDQNTVNDTPAIMFCGVQDSNRCDVHQAVQHTRDS